MNYYGNGIKNVNNYLYQPNGNNIRDNIINNNFSPIHNYQNNNFNNMPGWNSENKQIYNPLFHCANKIIPNNLFQNQFNNNKELNNNESKTPYYDRHLINNSNNFLNKNSNSNNMSQSQKKNIGCLFRESNVKQKNKNRNLKDSYQENTENKEKEDTLVALKKGGVLKENEEEIKTDIGVKEFLEYKNKENNNKMNNNYNNNQFYYCNNMKINEKKYFLNYKKNDMDNQNQPQYLGRYNNCIGGNDINILNINTNDGVKIILQK